MAGFHAATLSDTREKRRGGSRLVLFSPHVGRDLNEEGRELALVPVNEGLVKLLGREAADVLEDVIGLGDELLGAEERGRDGEDRSMSPGEL